MRRFAGLYVLLAALGGGAALAQDYGLSCQGHCGVAAPPTIPGVQGPWGTPVQVATPYMQVPRTEAQARSMMGLSLPMDLVQTAAPPPGVMTPGGAPLMAPPGMPPLPGMMPPQMPGMPGMRPPQMPPIAGAVNAVGALTHGMPPRFPTKRTSVRFVSPTGMKIAWYAPTADGKAGFTTTQREVPGRYNFVQGAIYRLKLSDIPNRPGLELYPTIEVVPSHARTDPFLAHSSVPVSFTDEDFNQVVENNYVVKVIYLPDPQYQDVAATGQPGELVSTLLEPGVDPIAEAHRRGNILLIIRMGNIDLETPDTPAMDAPPPYQLKPPVPVPPRVGMNPMMPGQPMTPYGPRPVMGPDGTLMMMGPNGPVALPRQVPAPQPGMTLPSITPRPVAPPKQSSAPTMQTNPSAQQPVQYIMVPTEMPPGGPTEVVEQPVEKKPSKLKRWFSR